MNKYALLSLTILFELFATTMLKYSDGFSILLPSIGVVVGYLLSFTLLGFVLKVFPLNMAYAIWSGSGVALASLASVILFGETMNAMAIVAIIFIIIGVVILSGTKTEDHVTEKEIS
ncbi:multidrug efflux SMR transporter [Paenibacillus sp. SYP-B3998]|uniref:Multidrug efflux SMR transporter n=1 Tax=Paenibacillus sp. SYP-B3998 TaxID=2678564 RepID=A0A6G3ZTN8_9BACL|nr:multidrug efflux SMR transporter [Paenibacillus sp. SYP-B3998]NEW05485.1 multidrug efflux SMR transporter [Paenibacillus sp. SYP-B3998]